jgi:putative ABC transport system permease protein
VVTTPDAGTERLHVVAVYDAAVYRSPLPGVLISAADYVRGFRPAGPGRVVIDAAPGVTAAASRTAVTAATARDPLLSVDTLADYKASLDSRIDTVLALFWALLGLAILIALLGIANTLTLSVIERTRESALIRALGLTRGQLRRMLLAEALLMTALAVGLGIGLGITFGLIMTGALGASASGREVTSIPYAQIALYAAISAGAAQAAALLPARRAARTAVVASMADA